MKYKIRRAKRHELDIMIEWAADEGWNPGLYDAESFHSADPKGYFLGFLDNEPISSISAVSYGGKFGILGFYIVKPDFRGKGYGVKIWRQALKYLDGQNIGLDGVISQQDNYKKSGFKLAYRNIRYEGKSSGISNKDPKIVKIDKIPFDQLLNYDNHFFPVTRDRFLRKWIRQPESLAIGFMENNKLNGYGMIRKCRTGYKIGPLFADSQEIAEKIFEELQSFMDQGTKFFLDVPEINIKAVKLAEKAGMKAMFETARMYSKFAPELPLNKVFGVTTFELG